MTTVLRINQSHMTAPLRLNRSESESYVTADGQSASLSWNKAPIWGLRRDLYYCQTVRGLSMWGVLSDERTGLSFTIAAGTRQRSHSRVRVPCDWRSYITVSDSNFPFRRLLRLAGLRWRYSLHGCLYRLPVTTGNVCCYGNLLTKPLASNGLVWFCGNVCLASRWLTMDFRSGSAIPAFSVMSQYIFMYVLRQIRSG
jgi:hypothetical protein